MRAPLRLLLALLAAAALAAVLAACSQGGDGAAEAAPVKSGEVVAKDLRFDPPAVEVPAGTAVTWKFEDGDVPHNVKGDGFASKNQTGGTFQHRFDEAGTYPYRCTLHPGMDGRVVVTTS